MNRIALIGDIVASRQISDRGPFQEKLGRLFSKLSRRGNGIDSPYTITIGDEFQALFHSADGVLRDAAQILSTIYPVKVRLSFGIGAITTKINRKQALGMDGPAFHMAREGLEMQKKKGKTQKSSTVTISGVDETSPLNSLLVHSLPILSHMFAKYSKTAFDILTLLYDDTSISQISQSLEVSIQAVYKSIRTHAMYDVLRYMQTLEKAINVLLEEQ